MRNEVMRIFLTGSTGFIGSHVLQQATAKGHDVVALRRTSTSSPAIALAKQPTWINGTLASLKPDHLEGCDVVIHLACAGVSPKQATWNELTQANVLGSAHLIAVAHSAGIDRFIAAGTCHEYGSEPLSPYAASKAAAFQLISTYAYYHQICLYYGIIFSAYGEGQYSGNFWPSLRQAALAGEDFPMTNGDQIRDFIPVELVASKLISAGLNTALIPGKPYVENICTGSTSTLLEFAQKEWLLFKATGRILPGLIPPRPNEFWNLTPSVNSTYSDFTHGDSFDP
jgi:nucleoside-diphosphate-sugar epimerase